MHTLEFNQTEAFAAYNAATNWLQSRGYSTGRMCGDSPIGFKEGDWDIAKWTSLDREDKKQLDGILVGDQRHGPVKLLFGVTEEPEEREYHGKAPLKLSPEFHMETDSDD